MIRRILIPLDGSALAEIVLPPARELAELLGASVTLLRAVEPAASTLDLAGAAPDERDAVIKVDLLVAEVRAHDYLAAVARSFERAGVATGAKVVVGPPAEQIIRAADEADLIVMSTHGRGGLSRLAQGSVADRVLHEASVPVLLVRGDGARTLGVAVYSAVRAASLPSSLPVVRLMPGRADRDAAPPAPRRAHANGWRNKDG